MAAARTTVTKWLFDPCVASYADTEISQLLLYLLFFAFLLLFLPTHLEECSSSSLPFCLCLCLSNSSRLLLAPEFFPLSLVSCHLLSKGSSCSLRSFLSLSGSTQFSITPLDLLDRFLFCLLRRCFIGLQLPPDSVGNSWVTPNIIGRLGPWGALNRRLRVFPSPIWSRRDTAFRKNGRGSPGI